MSDICKCSSSGVGEAGGPVAANDNAIVDGTSQVQECKDLLEAAAAGGGTGDGPWARGGMERLYFSHPKARGVLGSAELDTTVEVAVCARLELFAPPLVVAQVIEFVRGLEITEEEPVRPLVVMETKVEEPVAFLPPTKDPSPEDLLEDSDGLPPEVMEQDPDADQVRL
jgi:hypothetical protein